MQKKTKIRVMEKKDVSAVEKLVSSLSHFYLENKQGPLPTWFASTLTKTEFIKRVYDTKYSNFLLEINNDIVGYISMKGNHHLYHLFVSQNHQHKGIAKQLWQHVTQHCISNRYTLRSSIYAIPVYKKFGFNDAGAIQEKDGIYFQPMELKT